MPKSNEELEAELKSLLQRLEAAEGERTKLQTKIGEFEGKTKELENSKVSIEEQLKETLKLKEDLEKLKAAKPAPPASGGEKDDDTDVESLLNDDERKAAEEAFNKLSEEQQEWVVSDKKNKSQFLSDVIGKKPTSGRRLFVEKKSSLPIRDQIRQALNIELSEDIPSGGGSRNVPRQKQKTDGKEEITTSVPNGDVLGALRQLDKKK